jgi:hypothetical protein
MLQKPFHHKEFEKVLVSLFVVIEPLPGIAGGGLNPGLPPSGLGDRYP